MPSLPEMRLLVRSISPSYDASSIYSEAYPDLNWTQFCDLAGWHAVIPLFTSRLLSPPWEKSGIDVPIVFATGLKTYQEHHLRCSLRLIASLVELQREFGKCGITVLSWKGPSVGMLLYGSPTLRESNDLDFLFLEKDLHAILEIARRLGYQLVGTPDSESRYLYTLALQREFTLARERDGVVLEFHLQILPSRYSLWQDSQADIDRASTICRLGGAEILVQNPEDLLVSLCAHATKHKWDRLKWSCDIAQFLSVHGDTIDWPAFLTQLEQTQKHLVVLLGLGLAAKLFDMSLPAAVQNAVQRNTHVSNLVNHVADHIMSGSTGPIDFRHEQSMIALLCPRLRDRIAYRLRPLVELNYVDLHVPVHKRKLFFMNYIFRAVRLLKKYGPYRLATKTAASVRSGR